MESLNTIITEVKQEMLMYKGFPVFGKISQPHFNREAKDHVEDEACFVFVNQGELAIRAQTERLIIDKDNGLLAKCLNYFYEQPRSENAQKGVVVIGVLLYAPVMEELFDFDVTRSDYTVDFNLKRVEIESLLDSFKKSIEILIENPELADEAMIGNKLKEFVLLMSKIQGAPSHFDFLSAMFRPNAADFKATVQSNLFSSLTVDELAALCHMSTSSFKRKFKEVYNESPKKYIARKKLERATELLGKEFLRVSDIAYDVGFENISTFNRSFKTVYGQSPSEYRLTQIA